MISHIRPAVVMVAGFTALLGLAYPLAVTGIAQLALPWQANGSLIERDGSVVGSALIGQSFTRPEYLHPRPSATDPAYNAVATASGSGLDPHITLDAALRQVDRIAMARGLPATAVRDAIRDATTGPAFGLVGDPVVNVLTANLALDALKG